MIEFLQLPFLRFCRIVSQITNTDIFFKIYKSHLKGYKFLAKSLNTYFTGEYEKECFSYVIRELKENPKCVVFDLGANLGYFSMLCSVTSGSKAQIFAFEPIPSNMAYLCKHLLINSIANVTPINVAVSNDFGLIDFSADNNSVSYTYKKGSNYYGNKNVNIKIGIISLDLITANMGVPIPSIIKIDVEGAEYDVLDGARKLIKDFNPKILLSTHEVHESGVEDKCLNFLTEIGYNYKKIPNEFGRTEGLNDYWCTSKK